MEIVLDTSFVIAAEREARRHERGSADAFLAQHTADTFFLTFTVAGELACGESADAVKVWQRLCQPYTILPWNIDVSWRYGVIFRRLKQAGKLIGTNDLWIAATALVHGMPIATGNVQEFSRVEGLQVLSF